MDIFSHLKREHDQIRDLLEQINNLEEAPEERGELLSNLSEEYLTHAKGEEETFYKELSAHARLRGVIHGAHEEHAAIEELLEELKAVAIDDPEWMESFVLLRDTIEAHLDEEESKIFEQARQVLSTGDSERIFSRMRTAEEQYRAST